MADEPITNPQNSPPEVPEAKPTGPDVSANRSNAQTIRQPDQAGSASGMERVTLSPLPDSNEPAEPSAPVQKSELVTDTATSEPAAEQVEPQAVMEAAREVVERPQVSEKKPERPKRSAPTFEKPQPQRKETYRLVTFVSALRALIVTFAAAVIVGTIFMWWTSPEFLSAQTRRELAPVQATAEHVNRPPTALPTPFWFNRIGIVAGHSGIATYGRTKGNVDPGTVCPDGFNEADVVMKVAQQAMALLQGRGFTVDLLEEWDTRLDGYEAAAFVSLHADECANFDDGFNHSGFKLSPPTERFTAQDQDTRLADCMRQNYGTMTKLPFSPGGITVDMTDYHAFRQIAPKTPAIILEVGLLSYDRDLLEHHTDTMAAGVVNGLLCYLQPTASQPAGPQPAAPTGKPAIPSPTPLVAVTAKP